MRFSRVFAVLVAGSVATVALSLTTAAPAGAATIGALSGAGPRPGATQLSFKVADGIQAQVDVGSGNLYVTVRGLALPGVDGQVQLGAFYNSAASDASAVPRLGRGWGVDYTGDVRVVPNADSSATYYGPGGLTGVFTRTSGTATTYTSAAGFKSDLVKTSTGWTLTERESRTKRTFNSGGKLTRVEDRNGNATTVAGVPGEFSSYDTVTITSPAGPTTSRQAGVQTDAEDTVMYQTTATAERTVTWARTDDDMTVYTDAAGKPTYFGYEASGLLSYISACCDPGTAGTEFSWDENRRLTSINQIEEQGGPGDSTTRLAYPSATTTLLADPNTDQALPVDQVPRTTYTIDSTQRVTKAVDAAGRIRSKTYTASFDTLTAATGDGTGASTTTNTYAANGGESQTKTAAPTGAAQSLAYANPAGPGQYQPSSGTDDDANASTYTYNGAGNQLTAAKASGAQAKVTRNTDGTVATATSPGNGTNATSYGYTNKLLTSVTPPTGTSLGARSYTYNEHGLVATATNGRGITTTYTYDDLDRVTVEAFSGGGQVSYTYNASGNLATRTDTHGTTSYNYDQLGRLTFRSNTTNTSFGGEVEYIYDKASNIQAQQTPAGGLIYFDYDDSGVPTKIQYPEGAGRANLEIATDSKGRRTDLWMNVGATRATWKARHQIRYDNTGRVARVVADSGTGDTSYTRVLDTHYCYVKATTAPTCTANTANDRNKLQWQRDVLTGAVTTYSYDTSARLKSAVVTGTGAKTYSYTYNSNDNRLTATAQSQTLTYNPGNQITTTGHSYDGAGNMTAQPGNGTMTYTAADQLATVTKNATTYTYSHAGSDNNEILSQTTPQGTYKIAYGRDNAQGLPVIETVGKDAQTASVLNDPVTGQPLMLRTSSGVQALYLYDGTPGSPIGLLTSSSTQTFAASYDPYGVPTITTGAGSDTVNQNPYTFAGGLQDRVTGWVHYGARYYDPKTGSFTQQDTLDAPLDSLNANRYAYAGNDPVNNTDPTGLTVRGCVAAVLGIGGGFVGIGVGAVTSPTGLGIGVIISSGLFSLSSIVSASEQCS